MLVFTSISSFYSLLVSTDEIEAEIRATATVVQRLQDLEISFAEMLTDLPRPSLRIRMTSLKL